MTDDYAKEIGRLQSEVGTATKGIDSLFASNEKRKGEVGDLRLEMQAILHAVEETQTTSNRSVELMEELKKSVAAMTEIITHMDQRVVALENSRIDFVKVLKWFGSTRGVIFMIIMSAMFMGSFNPLAREFILEFIGIAGKVRAS